LRRRVQTDVLDVPCVKRIARQMRFLWWIILPLLIIQNARAV